jgi:outer membrane biosynthesis protein TonB
MRRMQRIVLLATLAAISPVLAGCADFDVDKLDIFHLTDKKKLPGDRQPLFPEGVPGVTQGIPQEYMKGNQPPPETALAAPVDGAAAEAQKQTTPPAEEPKAEAEAKPKPKPKPKKTAKKTTPKPKQQAAPVQPVTQQAAPAPWPAPAQNQASGNSNTAPWPSAPPPGTFSR